MPTYCYRSRDKRARVITRVFPSSDIPKSIVERGVRYDRAHDEEWGGISVPSSTWNTPLHCVASGVHPSQRAELEKYYSDHGVPTKVDDEGNPIYTSASHRKKALKCRGMYDKAAYY